MRRSFGTLAVMAAVALLAAAPLSPDAPADQYFGPLKMSALEIRSRIDKLGQAYAKRWADDDSIVHDAGLIESSLDAWAARYPHDHWLPPTAFHLAQLYQEIQTPIARAHARAMYEYLVRTFPRAPQAHLARLRLAHGFPPLVAESPVRPTANPYASPVAAASPLASVAPSTAPSIGPSMAPVAASATPTPKPPG